MSDPNFRLDLLQSRLKAEIVSVMPGDTPVTWTEQGFRPPLDGKPYVTLSMLAGPRQTNRSRARARPINLPSNVALTVSQVDVGKRYFVRCNQVQYWYDAVSGDTLTTVRDKLANKLQDSIRGTEPYVAAVESGSDGLVLTPAELGGLWDLNISGSLTAVVGALSAYKINDSPRVATVTIQAFSRETTPRKGASSDMNKIVSMLEDETAIDRFTAAGIAIWTRGVVIPVSAVVADTTFESRSSIDVDFALRSVTVRPVETITQADITTQGRFDGGPVVHTNSFSVEE